MYYQIRAKVCVQTMFLVWWGLGPTTRKRVLVHDRNITISLLDWFFFSPLTFMLAVPTVSFLVTIYKVYLTKYSLLFSSYQHYIQFHNIDYLDIEHLSCKWVWSVEHVCMYPNYMACISEWQLERWNTLQYIAKAKKRNEVVIGFEGVLRVRRPLKCLRKVLMMAVLWLLYW